VKIFKIIIIYLLFSFVSLSSVSVADNHETEKKQADAQSNITSEIENQEEPLPLNDPFAGDASLSSSSSLSGKISDEELENELSLYNFKLVAIMTGEYESYASLINSSGEILTLQLYEELSEGVILIALKPEEAVFQKADDKYLIINFNNQIKETSEAF